MEKTLTVTLENPITATRKFFARRKINKLNKQVDKKTAKIQQLEEKFFNGKSSKSTTKKPTTKKATTKKSTTNKATTKKVATMGKTIFFKAEKFDFEKVGKILDLEIEEYQSFGMKKYGDIGIKAKGSSDELAKAINKKKTALKKYGLHLEKFEKSLHKGAVIN